MTWRGRASLQRQIDNLRDGNGKLQEPPKGTALHKIWELVTGERRITRNRTDDSKPGSKLTAKIRPFGIGLENTSDRAYPAKVSKRAMDEIEKFITTAGLNHITDDKIEIFDNVKGFKPAVVTIFKPSGTIKSVSASNNKVTGRAYKTKDGKSYSYPFGTNNTTTKQQRELDARATILSTLTKKDSTLIVSFSSEIWK